MIPAALLLPKKITAQRKGMTLNPCLLIVEEKARWRLHHKAPFSDLTGVSYPHLRVREILQQTL